TASNAAQSQVLRYDTDAAEAQWEKVQTAQEVAVVKALPLRINLPKRGLYFSFAQVLQTETGKPMSVRFAVVNELATGWPTRIGLSAVGLLGLWSLVAATLRRRA